MIIWKKPPSTTFTGSTRIINNYIHNNYDGIWLNDNCYVAFNVIRSNRRRGIWNFE